MAVVSMVLEIGGFYRKEKQKSRDQTGFEGGIWEGDTEKQRGERN